MPDQEETRSSNDNFIDKFHEIEIQKVFDTLIWIANLAAQIGTFFGTANITALGIAFTVQKVGIVFFAALTFLFSMILQIYLNGFTLRYYYRAIILQKRFAPDDKDTFLDLAVPPQTEKKMRNLIVQTSSKKTLKELERLKVTTFLATPTGWISLIVILIEMGAGIILWKFYGWAVF